MNSLEPALLRSLRNRLYKWRIAITPLLKEIVEWNKLFSPFKPKKMNVIRFAIVSICYLIYKIIKNVLSI